MEEKIKVELTSDELLLIIGALSVQSFVISGYLESYDLAYCHRIRRLISENDRLGIKLSEIHHEYVEALDRSEVSENDMD